VIYTRGFSIYFLFADYEVVPRIMSKYFSVFGRYRYHWT